LPALPPIVGSLRTPPTDLPHHEDGDDDEKDDQDQDTEPEGGGFGDAEGALEDRKFDR
jgi:hypothetical protein